MKHSFVRYIGCVHIASQKLDKIRLITEKRIAISLYKDVTLYRKKHFCHTKLQTRVIRVVLSKFLYLIGFGSDDQFAIKGILAILKSALKLLITGFQYGQQMAFLENQIIFKSSVCPLVSMATNLHFDILMQHRTFKFMVFLQIFP